MTIEERAEKAAGLKKSGSCNCCQAVAAVLADQTTLDAETLLQIASGFGGGMGNMEATCGALIGAAQIAGLALSGNQTMRYARALSEKFANSCGADRCRDLKGKGTGAPLCACEDCVRNAVLAYGEVVGLNHSEPLK